MPGSALKRRMQPGLAGLKEAATKYTPTQKDLWTIWSILAIFSGCFLLLSLATTAAEVLAKSPHVLDWIAWTGTFSIWFFAAIYARRPEYYEAILQLRIARHHRSRADRIRAVCVFAVRTAGLLGLVFGCPILVGMVLWPGQSWGAYLVQAMPILRVETTALVAVAILRVEIGRASCRER